MIKYLILLILFMPGSFLPAQTTAVEIENLLNSKTITYAQAVRVILDASEVKITPSYAVAFRFAEDQGWLPKGVTPDSPARLDSIALLCMHSFGIKGGLMYTITGKPRYAYRELAYRGVIQGRVDPMMKVSGEKLLFMVGRLLTIKGEGERI